MKIRAITMVAVISAVLVLLFFAKDIMKFAFKHLMVPISNFVLGDQIFKLEQTIHTINKANQDNIEQLRRISDSLAFAYTKTSTIATDLSKEIDGYLGQNKQLRRQVSALLDSLKKTGFRPTSVQVGTSEAIQISGGGYLGDSTFVDPWITAKISSKDDSLLFRYWLTMYLAHLDIQSTDVYGNETHLNSYKLISSKNGKEYFIPMRDSVYTQKEKYPLFHWWNPKLHGGVLLKRAPGPYLGLNLATIGANKGIESTWIYLADIGLGYDKEAPVLLLSPIDVNLGPLLPMVRNVNISPMARFGDDGWGYNFVLNVVF
jgi:hypothetical protein